MAELKGRPIPAGASTLHQVRHVDTTQHPQHNLTPRAVRPINYSPLGPSTRHIAAPLKPLKVK